VKALGAFLSELKRRRVYRVAVVYAAVAFVIWQAAEIAVPGLNLPAWVLTLVILLTVLGFPVSLVLAWAFDITPEGVKRTEAESAEPVAPGKVERAAGEGDTEARKSIAVLPFADMSPESDQEYFSDGMSEELIDALTKIPGLRVTARTSSFQFKGERRDIREVGRALGVTHVLEGSVRKSGDRLRITAQLVDTTDGYHLWSERYDRDLSDIFEIQDEIAASIVSELRIRLADPPSHGPIGRSSRSIERLSWTRRTLPPTPGSPPPTINSIGLPGRRPKKRWRRQGRRPDGHSISIRPSPRRTRFWASLQ
jgi:TolB-like protein